MEDRLSDIVKKIREGEENATPATRLTAMLVQEIGDLNPNEVTEPEAIFIAGQFLARMAEVAYLEERINPNENSRSAGGKLQGALREAQEGNFIAMKKFVLSEAELMRTHIEVRGQANSRQRIGLVMTRIGELLPISGDGTLVRYPTPTQTGQSMPLRTQLQMLKQGGEIR